MDTSYQMCLVWVTIVWLQIAVAKYTGVYSSHFTRSPEVGGCPEVYLWGFNSQGDSDNMERSMPLKKEFGTYVSWLKRARCATWDHGRCVRGWSEPDLGKTQACVLIGVSKGKAKARQGRANSWRLSSVTGSGQRWAAGWSPVVWSRPWCDLGQGSYWLGV